MEHTDQQLLAEYKTGWHDCANGKPHKNFTDLLLHTAYAHGWIDFIAGDDVRSVDYQTDEEILRLIRKP